MIKPSGSEQVVAIISGNRILIEPTEMPAKLLTYTLGAKPSAEEVPDAPDTQELKRKLESFLQTATKSLLDNTAGVEASKNRN